MFHGGFELYITLLTYLKRKTKQTSFYGIIKKSTVMKTVED